MKRRFGILKPYKYSMRLKVTEDSIEVRIKKFLKMLRERQKQRQVEKKEERVGVNLGFYAILGAGVMLATIFIFLLLSLTLPFEIKEVGGWYGNVKWLGVNFGTVFDKVNGLYVAIEDLWRGGVINTSFAVEGVELSGKVCMVEGASYNVRSLRELYDEIEWKLQELGFMTERIWVEGIKNCGKGDIIVVATGKPPKGSVKLLTESLRRGAMVVYIGDMPYEEVDEEGELRSVKELWLKGGVEFAKTEPKLKDLNLEGGLFTMPRGGTLSNGLPYQKISKGTFVALPNYPDFGWPTYKELAEDITTTLKSTEIVGRELPLDETPTIVSLNSKRHLFGKIVFRDEEDIVALKPISATLRENEVYYHEKPIIPPTAIVDKPINLNVRIREMEGEEDRLYALIGEERVELGTAQKNTEAVFSLKHSFEKGAYIISIVGEKGGIYTLGGLIVSGIDADLYPDFEKNTLTIIFKSGGAPQRLDRVSVTIEGKTLTYENVKEVTIDLVKLLGDVPVGTYEVVIESGGERIVKTFTKTPKTGIGRLLNTTNLVILLLSFVIYMIGILFAKREEEVYSIIVPDVMPLKGKTVKIRKGKILELFDKVNAFYKWKYMPLTPKELVMGLKNGLVGVKAIVGEYNMRYVLDKLVDKGLVLERLGYYLPKDWVKKSGFSATILALFRKVRDIAISKVIPFTTKISPSQPYHMKLKLLWQDVYIYFYTKREDLKYILKNAPTYIKKGLVFIIVPNDELKEELLDALKGPGRGQKAIEIAMRTNNLFIMTIEEFSRKISEIKGG